MTDITRLRNEVLDVAAQSGSYTEFDLQQDDFTERAVRDFMSDLVVALGRMQEKKEKDA